MGLFRRHKSDDGTVSVTIELDGSAPTGAALPAPPAAAATGECLNGAVGADWMALPTLEEAGTQVPLAGTSHYQAAIGVYAGPRRPEGPTNDLVMAQLVEVMDGPYAGSVAVYVGGDRVGSLRHGLAEVYRPVLAKVAGRGLPATCRGAIYGGHYGDDPPGWRNFGVGLYQSSHPRPAPEGAPFLPPGVGIRVTLSEGVAERLDAGLNSKAKSKVGRTSGVIDPDGWKLSLDGEVVGVLEPYGGLSALRLVQAAADAGWPLTCHVRVIREPAKPLRVMADLPCPTVG